MTPDPVCWIILKCQDDTHFAMGPFTSQAEADDAAMQLSLMHPSSVVDVLPLWSPPE